MYPSFNIRQDYIAVDGAQWNKIDGSADGEAVESLTSSADGSTLLSAGRYTVRRSVDFGATWTTVTALSLAPAEWRSVQCSGGLEVCLALQHKGPTSPFQGSIYRSTDGGVTWAAVPGTDKGKWYTASSDATGQQWIAALGFNRNGNNQPGGIYVSTDMGQSFTLVPGSDATLRWRVAACDETFADCVVGSTFDANDNLYKLYRLTNLQTLAEIASAPLGDYSGLVMSPDGSKILASLEYAGVAGYAAGAIYYSLNGGQSCGSNGSLASVRRPCLRRQLHLLRVCARV